MEEVITGLWQRIEAHLQTQGRTETLALNPPASEDDIIAAEKALAIERFPEDFRCSLKRHNGQDDDAPILLGIGHLLTTHDIVREWGVWKGLLDEGTFADNDDDADTRPGAASVKPNWWNPRWIPITHDGAGDHDCMDLDPADGVSVGQIIEMWHDDGDRPLKAPSFEAWLSACADDLEQGRLAWEDDWGFVSTPSQPNNPSEIEGCL